MSTVEKVIERVKQIEGVLDAQPLTQEQRNKIEELEKQAEATGAVSGMMKFINEGVWEALKREKVIVVFADDLKGFRPPPQPWVMICDENGFCVGEWLTHEQIEKAKNDPNCIFMSSDFVLYKDRYKSGDVHFVMPAMDFPEAEEVEGVKNVTSGTPSPPADSYIREITGHAGTKYWAILLGWDEA